MKGIGKLFSIVLLGAFCVVVGCADDSDPFRVESRISGLVTFRNPLVESAADSAKGVSITMVRSNESWTTTAPRGFYDYPFLSEGSYNISFSYSEGGITYGYDTLVILDNDQHAEVSPTLLPTDGHLQLSGAVTYIDLLSSSADTVAAIGALVELFDDEENLVKATSVVEEGEYLLDSLKSGDYFLRTTLVDSTSSEFIYIKEDEVKISSSTQMNQQLSWNGEGALLIVEILDSNDLPIKNAQVCIYQNEALFNVRPAGCLGSLTSIATNSNGKVVFNELDDRAYWIEGIFHFGDLSSISNDMQVNAVPDGAITLVTINLN